jgi:hypothetical protein
VFQRFEVSKYGVKSASALDEFKEVGEQIWIGEEVFGVPCPGVGCA